MRLPNLLRTASFRLAAGFALVFALSALALGAFVYFVVNSTLDRHRQTRIDAEIAFLESKYRTEGIAELVEEVRERIRTSIVNSLDYLVLDQDRKPIAGNLPFVPDQAGWFDVAYGAGTRASGALSHIRLHVVDFDSTIRLAVGDDLGPAEEINAAVVAAFAWAFVAFVLFGTVSGVFLSSRFLGRVDAIRRTADAIVGGDLTQRVVVQGTGDDFDRLSSTLNRMLDRIQNLMESLRQVSNDIAHELRTPLTRLRQRLEGTLAEPPTGDRNKAIEAAIAETDSIIETFSALLRIAQMSSGTSRAEFVEVDVSGLFAAIVEALIPVAEEDGKRISADLLTGCVLAADRELLTQMLTNILENAIQHTPKGTHIRVRFGMERNGPVATVSDDGPGVPKDQLAAIFERFYRVPGRHDRPGSGLGLAIAKAIADLHNVTLVAEEGHPGLRITMRFPTR